MQRVFSRGLNYLVDFDKDTRLSFVVAVLLLPCTFLSQRVDVKPTHFIHLVLSFAVRAINVVLTSLSPVLIFCQVQKEYVSKEIIPYLTRKVTSSHSVKQCKITAV